MAEQETKRYLELQMEELKDSMLDAKETPAPQKTKEKNPQNAEMARLYEDAAEYEKDLQGFEDELEIVNNHDLKDIADALIKAFPEENKERDYIQELNNTVNIGWAHAVEVKKTHPVEQLTLVKETEFSDIVERLSAAYPDYEGDFEKDVREHLVKRWENLIAIKTEHIKQEHAEIKTAGLKPKYVKRAYQQFHGIVK